VVLYDSKGWAFHRISQQIERHLAGVFDVVTDSFTTVSAATLAECDACILLFYGGISFIEGKLPSNVPLITCVYDYHLWPNRAEYRKLLDRSVLRSTCVMAACPAVADLLSIRSDVRVSNIIPCFDGVDSKVFAPTALRQHDRLVVGWAGNSDEAFHGAVKGLALIREAVALVPGARLVLADRAHGAVAFEAMPAWYAGIDLLVCGSACEGTPNPILEAASCGRAIVSTDVGIVRSLFECAGGPMGAVVERTVSALAEALRQRLDRARLTQEGLCARQAVENGWDWACRVQQFERAIRVVTGGSDATL
jgi:glycosyltransferase involved in cell wall biosynthesis